MSNWDNVMSVGIAPCCFRSGQGGVLSSPQSVSFAGGTFQSTDRPLVLGNRDHGGAA